VLDALVSLAWKRPWTVLSAALALLALLALAAAGAGDRLGHPPGAATADQGAIVLVTKAEDPVSPQVYAVALEAVSADL